MPLSRSLADAGFSAWTPAERVKRRLPRSRAVEHRTAPITPTYVFVQAEQLHDLSEIEGRRHTGFPAFSIARHNGKPLLTTTPALAPLLERHQSSYLASLPLPPHAVRHARKRRANPFSAGETLVMAQGPFAGLECIVEEGDGQTTSLTLQLFGRQTNMKIETFHLRSDGVATAAYAA